MFLIDGNEQGTALNWVDFIRLLVREAGIVDEAVEDTVQKAFSLVPRDLFLEPRFVAQAANDVALPCGFGESILKPSVLIRMASLVGIRKGHTVLDAGSGSGYLAAVLAKAGCHVCGVESVGLLAQRTRKMLDMFSLESVLIKRGDPLRGWSEQGPFRSIILSKPIVEVPLELLKQLINPGGLLVGFQNVGAQRQLVLWEARRTGFRQYLFEYL